MLVVTSWVTADCSSTADDEPMPGPGRWTAPINRAFTLGSDSRAMDEPAPTVSDDEIFDEADALLLRHGHDAVAVALGRANQLLGQGNMDGYRMWRRIILVMDDIFAVGPRTASPSIDKDLLTNAS